MITLDQMQQLHPTAKVDQLKTMQLFLVHYPGLILAVSFKSVIAFNFDGEWYISTEKLSRISSKHAYYLREIFTITHWFSTRKELLQALKRILSAAGSE